MFVYSCACGDINHRDCGHYDFFIMWQYSQSKSELLNLTNISRNQERDSYNSVKANNMKYRMRAKNEIKRAHENHK